MYIFTTHTDVYILCCFCKSRYSGRIIGSEKKCFVEELIIYVGYFGARKIYLKLMYGHIICNFDQSSC